MPVKKTRLRRISPYLLLFLILGTNCIWILWSNWYGSQCYTKTQEYFYVGKAFHAIASELRSSCEVPDNIKSSEGETLLSWRVLVAKSLDHRNEALQNLDLTKPWNDPEVEKSVAYSTPLCLDPTSNDGSTTRIVRINEIDSAMREGTLSRSSLRNKAYIVLLKPQYAFPVAKPYDVSWRSLASGEVELQELRLKKPLFIFCTVYGEIFYRERLPETEAEWQELCGTSDIETNPSSEQFIR